VFRFVVPQDDIAFEALQKDAVSRIEDIEKSLAELLSLQVKICPAQCKNLVKACSEGIKQMKETYDAVYKNGMWDLYYSKKLKKLIGPLDKLSSTLGSSKDLLRACGSQWGRMGLDLSIPPSIKTVSKFDLLINELSWNLDMIRYALNLTNDLEFQWHENRLSYVLGKRSNSTLLQRIMTTLSFGTGQATPKEMELRESENVAREKLFCGDRDQLFSSLQEGSILTAENSDPDSIHREQTNFGDLASVLKKRLQLQRFELEESSVLECFRISHRDLKIRRSVKTIGEGGFKTIYRGEWCGQVVAIGVMQGAKIEAVRKEALVMLNVQHPNIVDLLGWGFVDGPQPVGDQMLADDASLPADDDNDVLRPSAGYIVMELMPGDLWRVIEQRTRSEKGSPFPMSVAVDILLQIARAMLHMHDLGHMHRDLKASNCLVNLVDGIPYTCTVKLIDFGNSKKFNPKELAINTANSGTRTHMAPEVWATPRTISVPYTESADAYSFGMVCFEVISGLLPCGDHLVTKESFFGGRQTALSLPASTSCPEGLKELMSKCWFHSPNARPNFKEIVKSLWTIRTQLELE
jgi:hypothetical protein